MLDLKSIQRRTADDNIINISQSVAAFREGEPLLPWGSDQATVRVTAPHTDERRNQLDSGIAAKPAIRVNMEGGGNASLMCVLILNCSDKYSCSLSVQPAVEVEGGV